MDKKADAILEGTFEAPGVGPINRDLARTSFFIQSGDAAPSQTAQAVLEESCTQLNKNLTAWHDLDSQAVPTRQHNHREVRSGRPSDCDRHVHNQRLSRRTHRRRLRTAVEFGQFARAVDFEFVAAGLRPAAYRTARMYTQHRSRSRATCYRVLWFSN